MASKMLLRGGALTALAALTGGAWFAGRQVRSPGEAAATARPPAASRITAPVEERVIEAAVIVRGLVRYGDPRPVVLASSAVKTGTGAPRSVIVSTPAAKGTELTDGDAALVLGGRPVFILEGAAPAYRDMRPRDSGADVRQLETALARLGFAPGTTDGRYDDATESAVERWYRAAGYEPFGPTEAQRSQLRTARDNLSRADDAVLTATRALDQAARAVSGDNLLSAEEQVRTTEEKLSIAKGDAVKAADVAAGEVAAAQEALDLATRALAVAELGAARARRDAPLTIEEALDAVETAKSQLRQAQAAQSEAEAQRPVADAAVADAKSQLPMADAALADAIAQVPIAQATLADATVAAEQARKDLETAKRTNPTTLGPEGIIIVQDNTAQVRQAEAAVRAADAAVRQSELAIRTADAGVRQAEGTQRTAASSLRQAESSVVAVDRAVEARRAEVTDADRGLGKALAAVERVNQTVDGGTPTITEADHRVETARIDVRRAERQLAAAKSAQGTGARQNAAALRQAEAAGRIASAQLRALREPNDIRSATKQLSSARQSRERAAEELRTLEAEVGIVVPADEVLFFPTLPLRVDEAKAQRGDVVTGPVMTVSTSKLAVDTSVDTAEAKLIKVGSAAVVESSEFDVDFTGTITQIASTPGTKGVDANKVYVEVTPSTEATAKVNTTRDAADASRGATTAPTDAVDLNGSSVKITIPIRSTGKAVLAVPVAAVSVGSDGSPRVEIEIGGTATSTTRFATVRTGLAAGGFVAVTPVEGDLRAGTRVVVGNRDGSTLEGVLEVNDKPGNTAEPTR